MSRRGPREGRLRWAAWAGGAMALVATGLGLATAASLEPLPESLERVAAAAAKPELADRRGVPLTVTYQNDWNVRDRIPLHRVPPLLRDAMVAAEDRHFYEHAGVDWRARAAAVVQNLRAGRSVRGASTITEQVVRMLHPRPRTLWSRWIEGFEAGRLERRATKGEILSFYLDQVPYARKRRGVVQAARDLFDRDLDTLHRDELLALAVLVRSPSGLDPRGDPRGLVRRVRILARHLAETGRLAPIPDDAPIDLAPAPGTRPLPVSAPAFVAYVRSLGPTEPTTATTLDARLQATLQAMLDRQVERLHSRGVTHAAALVVDHDRDEILAWVNAASGTAIDAVQTPRQPGSTLKPFLYGLALERGYTAASILDDSPIASPVGHGLHHYRNYSGLHRGPIRLRLALANSLNVPAIRVMQGLPDGAFLERLRALGITSLRERPDYYGDGLALGSGEVTLFELVRAYATLARGGLRRPLHVLAGDERRSEKATRVFDPEVSSIVTDILADRDARALEFGPRSVLDLPIPAAVKTGTSNDYRDAWAMGYAGRYTIGVWMGDLERRPMKDVTGSVGPAVVLRSALDHLFRFEPAAPLPVSRRLRAEPICAESGERPGAACPIVEEWFRPGHGPTQPCPLHSAVALAKSEAGPIHDVSIRRPTPGLHLAMDPRIPDELEVYEFVLDGAFPDAPVEWEVDGRRIELRRTGPDRWEWPLARGDHRIRARLAGDVVDLDQSTAPVEFHVR